MNDLWSLVANQLNEHTYMTGIERPTERVHATAEIFTPTTLVVEILRYLDLELFAPGQTVLDPACGDGQFLAAAKCVKIFHHGMSETAACADLFGVDLMRDNVDLCIVRLGGGTIVMGDTLDPTRRLDDQTDVEHKRMIELFDEPAQKRKKKQRLISLEGKTKIPNPKEMATLF